jgi:preprotein translocase subunit SecD
VVIEKHWAENKPLMAKKINLGLDLQGGMHLVFRADFDRYEDKLARRLSMEEYKEELEKMIEAEMVRRDDQGNIVLTDKHKKEITQQALELLRTRVDKFGVSEPSIRPRGNENIEVQLPGVQDPVAVKKAIGTTGRVEYRLVDDVYTARALKWSREKFGVEEERLPLPTELEELEKLRIEMAEAIEVPDTLELLYEWEANEAKKVVAVRPMVLRREVALDGNDIATASVGQDEMGSKAVDFQTTPEGAAKFAEVTSKRNLKKRLAIVIDDQIRSAPAIQVQISSGKAQITGRFTQEEVKALARIIKEGALPVGLIIEEERTVGPSLGKDAINAGVFAILIGLSGVMVFMLIWYKLSGIIANLGLVLNIVFMTAILSLLGFTLTLPGIAGFILTVGMAVDANVIIFERIKEELRGGKSVRMSILYGYDRAFWTIFDANLTTLIAAFILSQWGTGPIKGFAVTLFIGVLSSMFVALYVTRFAYEMISLNKKLKKLSI